MMDATKKEEEGRDGGFEEKPGLLRGVEPGSEKRMRGVGGKQKEGNGKEEKVRGGRRYGGHGPYFLGNTLSPTESV